MDFKSVAYVVVSAKSDGSYRGGIMVVDRRGLPVEFHYSEKVNPTKIQKVLYGNVLTKFIKENVLCENLFSALKNKPDLLITDDREFESVSDHFDLPVIYLERTKAEQLKKGETSREIGERSVLFQAQKFENPLMLRFLNVEPDKQKDLIARLVKLSETIDLLEPLSRIDEALAVAEKEEEK